MPLADERAILKQIFHIQTQIRDAEKHQAHQAQIQRVKDHLQACRQQLGPLGHKISLLKAKWELQQTAQKLGCAPEELVGTKVACPSEQVGRVIGKKGQTKQQLMKENQVTLEVAKDKSVRVVGAMASVEAVQEGLQRILQQTQESVDLDKAVGEYLTAKGIRVLAELRLRHPTVHLSLPRPAKAMSLRGLVTDVESAKQDLLSLEIVEKSLEIPSYLAGAIIGKNGTAIVDLVTEHQATIKVQKKDEVSSVSVAGPIENLIAALGAIDSILEENMEVTHTLPAHPSVRNALLSNNGSGMQRLNKLIREQTQNESLVLISFVKAGLSITCKSKLMTKAKQVAQAEISRIEDISVRIPVDAYAIPRIIGKRGENMKKLKSQHSAIDIDFYRDENCVVVAGLDQDMIAKAEIVVRKLVSENQIIRIDVPKKFFEAQYRLLLSSKTNADIKKLAFLTDDQEKSQIVLRGETDKLEEARKMLTTWMEENYSEWIDTSEEDLEALTAGGKKSKIATTEKETDTKLTVLRRKKLLEIKGKKDNVEAAVASIKCFLYGGEGMSVVTMELNDTLSAGLVIGKGGKMRQELEEKHESVKIVVPRGGAVVTIRGKTEPVEACRQSILRIIATAAISEEVPLEASQLEVLKGRRGLRDATQDIPLSVKYGTDKVVLRGCRRDLDDAMSLLHLVLGNQYDACLGCHPALVSRIRDTESTGSQVKRIEAATGATVTVKDDKLRVKGTREAVIAAKHELLKVMDFLQPEKFKHMTLLKPAILSVTNLSDLLQLEEETGAQLYLDRDTESILIYASDNEALQRATEVFEKKNNEASKLMFTLRFEESEDWIVAAFVGKGGSQIKTFRTELKCTIEVDSKKRVVTVNSTEEDKVSKAREAFEAFVEKNRSENFIADLTADDVPAFLGKNGSNVSTFEEEHGVKVLVTRGNTLRLSGDAEKVTEARKALEDWLNTRAEARKESEVELTLTITKNQVPVILGEKGATIRSLESEFKVQIKVDRSSLTVSIRGKTADSREAALDKIKALLKEDEATEEEESSPEVAKPVPEPTVQKNTPKRPKSIDAPRASPTRVQDVPDGTDFPCLPSSATIETASMDDSSSVDEVSNGPSWAAVVSIHPSTVKTDALKSSIDNASPVNSHPLFRSERAGSFMSQVSEEDWDATSVGSTNSIMDEMKALNALEEALNKQLGTVDYVP